MLRAMTLLFAAFALTMPAAADGMSKKRTTYREAPVERDVRIYESRRPLVALSILDDDAFLYDEPLDFDLGFFGERRFRDDHRFRHFRGFGHHHGMHRGHRR